MTVVVKNNNNEEKFEVNYTSTELIPKIDDVLPRIETQLNTSVDFILTSDNEATFLCDGVNPMLFEFIIAILKRELNK